jgi:hypothetical protein
MYSLNLSSFDISNGHVLSRLFDTRIRKLFVHWDGDTPVSCGFYALLSCVRFKFLLYISNLPTCPIGGYLDLFSF